MAAWRRQDRGRGKFLLQRILFLRFQFQLDVLVFQDFWRSEQLDVAGGECGLVISGSIGFEQTQHLKERGSDFAQIQFGFDVEDGIEIGCGQARAGEGI